MEITQREVLVEEKGGKVWREVERKGNLNLRIEEVKVKNRCENGFIKRERERFFFFIDPQIIFFALITFYLKNYPQLVPNNLLHIYI